MIEIYLFINPLDESSLTIEKRYLKIIAKETEKIHFKMIPLLNPQVIQNYLVHHDISIHDLERRNQLFKTIYSACLDCKAVQLQSRLLGRKFLFELQERVGCQREEYSEQLVFSILENLKIDINLFKIDRQSKLVIDFFKVDQQVANEMGIEYFTDAVIFNYNCERDFGVLVDFDTPEDVIQELFKTDYHDGQFSDDDDNLHLYKKG